MKILVLIQFPIVIEKISAYHINGPMEVFPL